jgi:hypothetical protein
MAETFNIYCDESCHLERDHSKLMMLGAVWCRTDLVQDISERLRDIKTRHNFPSTFEVKWTKVSPSKVKFYADVIDYFFDDDDLHFRGYLIEKDGLDHLSMRQTHDEWYYKMCFRMLEPIIDPRNRYRVYLDIKDSRSELKRERLEDELRTKVHDHSDRIIERVQQIRSHESEIMQITDLLLGAVLHHNRWEGLDDADSRSPAKAQLIRRIQKRSHKDLSRRTWLLERKFNLFRWQATEI